jgi:hypothetical protein
VKKIVAAITFVLWSVTVHANAPAEITVSVAPSAVKVEAELVTPTHSWSFRNAYAGSLGFAERITDFRAVDASGQNAGAKNIAPGEFRSDRRRHQDLLHSRSFDKRMPLTFPTSVGSRQVAVFSLFADLIPRDHREPVGGL